MKVYRHVSLRPVVHPTRSGRCPLHWYVSNGSIKSLRYSRRSMPARLQLLCTPDLRAVKATGATGLELMKIVMHAESRGWRGSEKWLCTAAAGLAGHGHHVLVSCVRNSAVAKTAAAAGLRITHSRPGGDADLGRAFDFAVMLRREHPDVVLLTSLKKSFWAGWAARRAGVPRVMLRLGVDRGPDRWKHRYALRHYIDALLVNSDVIRQRLAAAAPWFPAHEVYVVLNSVQPASHGASTLRAELAIPADVPILAAAGWLEPRKGFDVLLTAFAALDRPDTRLVVAGPGPDEASLRAQATALRIDDRVHWLGFREDMPNVLAGANVFVLPSRREGMAFVMLEAMAADLLVVATDISGVREALGAHSGRPAAGWIVPPDDAKALARGIDEVLAALDSGEAARRREESRYRVRHWFSTERMIRETECALTGRAAVPPG
jgi:glycosyltransferase involved in cell wall biosynthesis